MHACGCVYLWLSHELQECVGLHHTPPAKGLQNAPPLLAFYVGTASINSGPAAGTLQTVLPSQPYLTLEYSMPYIGVSCQSPGTAPKPD